MSSEPTRTARRCFCVISPGIHRSLNAIHCSWAVKAETGKFLPPEILAMVHGYLSLEDDEDDFGDCDSTDSEIYNGKGRFGTKDEDESDGSE